MQCYCTIVSSAVLLSNLAAGDGPVLLSNVSCNQSHTRLSQCVRTEEIGLLSCDGGRIAGVACRTDAPTTTSSTTMSSEVPTSSTATSTMSPTNPIPPVPSANTMPQLGAIIGAVVGVLAVGIIATILVVVVVVLVAKRRSKGERVTTKGPGKRLQLVSVCKAMLITGVEVINITCTVITYTLRISATITCNYSYTLCVCVCVCV